MTPEDVAAPMLPGLRDPSNRVSRRALHAMMVFFVSVMAVYMAYKAMS